jgi:very-short-patch-repair endonuclease
MNLCKCGCGKIVEMNYRKGHGRRGKSNSRKHNLAISKANKGRKRTFKQRKKTSIGLKKYYKEHPISMETRKKISETAKKNGVGKWMLGRKLPPEVIEKGRLKRIGHITTEETKRKIGEANSGKNNGMYGHKYSEKEKEFFRKTIKENWKKKSFRKKWNKTRATPEFKRCLRENALKVAEKIRKKGYHNTKPELEMEKILKSLKIKYIHPYPIWDIEHCFSADFFIPKIKTIIEVDGIYWHNLKKVKRKDKIRNKEMKNRGYNVIRIWENEITKESVQKAINNSPCFT